MSSSEQTVPGPADSTRFWTRAFVTVAILEALSWLGLLVAMYFKWIAETTDAAVKVAGPIHGAMFLSYVAVTFIVAGRLRWSQKTLLLGLAASVPPLCTLVFERWVQRRGLLDAPRREA